MTGKTKEDGTSETSVTRVHRLGTNLWRVNEVNSVSRAMASGQLSVADAYDRLMLLSNEKPPFSPAMTTLGAALCGAAFTLMFGGTLLDGCVSAISAVIAHLICMLA